MANSEKKSLIELSLIYRQIPILLVVFLCVVGIHSFLTMPRQEFPEFKVRQGLVIAAFPGASSAQVDNQLAKPLQNYLFGYKEINKKNTYSVSKEGQTIVFVAVNDDVSEPDVFWSKLRLGLQEFKMKLPRQVLLLIGDNNFGDSSSLLLSITSQKRSYRELEDYLIKLEDLVRRNEKVSDVRHFGLQKEKIIIHINSNRMAYYGIKLPLIASALELESLVGYGGEIITEDSALPIHLSQQFVSEVDVANQIVYTSPKGDIVRVKDIARVERGYDICDSYVENSGNPAIVLSLSMRAGNNIVQFGKEIDKIISKFEKRIPEDVKIFRVADAPAVVKSSINHFFRDFSIAIVSVILIIAIFLPKRVAAVAAVTIPISIFVSMGILEAFGVELNTVSLASLVLVLGMIVDNSIIVIDNYVEKLDHNLDGRSAAVRSSEELVIPVLTATLAIIAAFAPTTTFMTGMFKEFVMPVPITVTVTLFISLLIAVFFVPILSERFIKTGITNHGKSDRTAMLDRLQKFYDSRISSTMKYPEFTILLGVASIVVGIVLLGFVPQQIFPKLDRNQFAVEIYFPEGVSLSKNAKTTREMAEILAKDARVKNVISFIGTSSPRFNTLYAPQIPAKNYSQLIVITKTAGDAKKILEEYDPKYRDAFPEAHAKWKQLDFLPAAAPIEVRIYGDTIEEIKTFADSVKNIMKQEKDITWIRDDFRDLRVSIDLNIDKNAANGLGITRGTLGLAMLLNNNDISVTTIWERDYSKPVILKYEKNEGHGETNVLDQYLPTSLFPKPIMVKQVSSAELGFSNGQIVRRNGIYTLTVYADVAFGKLTNPIFNRLSAKIKKLPKSGIDIDYGGEREMLMETYLPFGKSLIISIMLIFLILFFQFKNMRIVFLVMFTMPLSLIGGMLGLLVIGYPFGMTAFIGFIGLFGIVIRNGVILISYALELQSQGMSVRDAAIAAGKRRMRPIFLTASAAAVGVVPLITSGSLLWGPLGTVICFGLIGSTILTLYVLPVAYWQFGVQEKKK